jgi:hypothetical protein
MRPGGLSGEQKTASITFAPHRNRRHDGADGLDHAVDAATAGPGPRQISASRVLGL